MDRRYSNNPFKLSRSQSFDMKKNKFGKSGSMNSKFSKYETIRQKLSIGSKSNELNKKTKKGICLKDFELGTNKKIIISVGVVLAIILIIIISLWIHFAFIKGELGGISIEPYPKNMKYPKYIYKEIMKQ